MESNHMNRLEPVTISPEVTLSEAMTRLDEAGTGALVLCGKEGNMVGLLADGDIRRALLQGVALDTPVANIMNTTPVIAKPSLSKRDALQMMIQREIDQLPVIDDDGKLVDLLLRKKLVAEENLWAGVADRIEKILIHPDRPISEAIAQLDEAGTGALVISAKDRNLEGILTDGDLRRAVLQGDPLELPCGGIANTDPFKVTSPISDKEALELMTQRDINQLPVVDDNNRLLDLMLRRDLAKGDSLNLSAVVMAGGFGKRLMPLTKQVPKPMLPVGDKPLLERTVDRFRQAGIRDIHFTTHHLPEQIQRHFGDGEKFGVHIDYAQEDHPMGTAGGVRLLKRPSQPMIVINGDILTGVNFEEMYNFHKQQNSKLTVGVRKYEIEVPFGVVDCEDVRITALKEKPVQTFFVNAGIYLLEPTAYDLIPEGERFDMTDLIVKLIDNGKMVVSFPITEYWLDIGRHEDYQRAQEDFSNDKV